ncbi:type II secretion system secretin GspD [Chiayiivirga flava]|nr:type II secretion system secretin GspD [Chiayiivirga flava]
MAALVILAGCATVPDAEVPLRAYDPNPPQAQVVTPMPAVEQPSEEDYVASEDDPLRSVRMGSGRFINEEAARRPPASAGAAGDAEATFNFEGESLFAVVKTLLGDFLQQNYVIAPGVQGTVTFSTAKPLRREQVISVLEMLLRWNNATMVWQDGRYTILPVAQALPGNLSPRIGPPQNIRGYEVRAVPLQYISAVEMEKLLKPYAKPEGIVSIDPARNMLVLAGSRAEIENYLQTIAVFDVDWLSGMSVGVFPLQQAEAAKTVTELEKIFGEGSNTPLAGMFRFMPLEGINGVLVITPQPKYLATIEEWMERFDIGGGQAGQRLYVYDVKNVKAIDLAGTLADVFDTGQTITPRETSSGVAPGLESVEIRSVGADGSTTPPSRATQDSAQRSNDRNRNARGSDQAGGGAAGGPVVDNSGGIALAATDEVRVSAVEESNALLVLATSGQWESIRRVIERLDTIPLQVHIEAKILQVNLNNSLKYGVQWYFENAIGASTGGGGDDDGGDDTPALDPSLRDIAANRHIWGDISGTVGSSGLGWTFLGPNLAAVINALDTVSTVQVLSAPSLVVLNNKSASINVGTQIPVNSSFINTGGIGTDPNTGVGQSTYVQFRDTGITLNVTPRVNPGGLVFMEIDQTDSTPGAAVEGQSNVPVDQRKIKTEIAVQSGETVLLGGLIKQTDSKGSSGVPFLQRIPVLGALFGTKDTSSARQELLVVLTPTVIRNGEDAKRLTEEYTRQFRGLEPLRVKVDNNSDQQQ